MGFINKTIFGSLVSKFGKLRKTFLGIPLKKVSEFGTSFLWKCALYFKDNIDTDKILGEYMPTRF